jgi:proteasome assembly chaperone (PAC2) family protein
MPQGRKQRHPDLADVGDLVDPVMVLAFQGWNDAGEAATGALEHLEDLWDAQELTTIDPDEYYDFQVSRPTVHFDDEGQRKIEWPTTRISLARPEGGSRDIVLIRGIEPNMRWRAFCAELLDIAAALNVTDAVSLGALLADVPHTRPVPVTVSASEDFVAKSLGLEASRYEGSVGIVGAFQDAAVHFGLQATSIWAAVPHYVAQSPCPKATLVLLAKIEDLLNESIPLGDLPDEAQAWQHGVEEMTSEDPEIADYVARLERARDTTELPEASGEYIAKEFERYLRRRGPGPTPE